MVTPFRLECRQSTLTISLRPWDPNRIGVVDVCCSWSFVGTMCAWCFSDESLWTPCKFTLITPPLLWLYWWFYVALLNEWHTRQWCWRIRTAPLSFSPALYNGNEWKPSGATGVNVHFCLLEIFSVFFLLAFGQGYDNFLPSAITFD